MVLYEPLQGLVPQPAKTLLVAKSCTPNPLKDVSSKKHIYFIARLEYNKCIQIDRFCLLFYFFLFIIY